LPHSSLAVLAPLSTSHNCVQTTAPSRFTTRSGGCICVDEWWRVDEQDAKRLSRGQPPRSAAYRADMRQARAQVCVGALAASFWREDTVLAMSPRSTVCPRCPAVGAGCGGRGNAERRGVGGRRSPHAHYALRSTDVGRPTCTGMCGNIMKARHAHGAAARAEGAPPHVLGEGRAGIRKGASFMAMWLFVQRAL
jgi:hypothetical protein